MTDVALVEMPLFNARTASLALSLLSGSLSAAQISNRVLYMNLAYAGAIGENLYQECSERVPANVLLGDLIFSPLLASRDSKKRELAGFLRSVQYGQGDPTRLPEWLPDCLPALTEEAERLVDALCLEVETMGASLVGFTTTFNIVPSLVAARAIKERLPGVSVALGGANCEGEMGLELANSFPFLDFVCQGAGDRTIVEVAHAVAGQNVYLGRVPGLIWRDDDGAVRRSAVPADNLLLDDAVIPTFDDWVEQLELNGIGRRKGQLMLPLLTSRGCWYGNKHQCLFCGLNGLSMAFTSKSPDRVVHEIAGLTRYGIPNVIVVDNILDMSFFKSVLPRIEKAAHELSIFFEVKANLSKEQVGMLKMAGVDSIQPGIESLSSDVLKRMDKGVKAYQNVRLLKWGAETGVSIAWNWLYGFPGEDPEIYRKMSEMLPLLFHLEPPSAGRVRMDRFSPLFDNWADLGIQSVAPGPVYNFIYENLPEDSLRKVAYYYEFEHNWVEHPNSYAKPLLEVLREWRSRFGEEAFVHVQVDGAVHLGDSRGVSMVRSAVLEGLARDVYLAADAGAGAKRIASDVGSSVGEVQAILDSFVEKCWVILLDGMYLSLSVEVGRDALSSVPVSILPDVAVSVYKNRMSKLHAPVTRDLAARDARDLMQSVARA